MVDVDYGVLHTRVLEAEKLVIDLLKDEFDSSKYDRWETQLLRSDLNSIVNKDPNRSPLLEDGSRIFLGKIGDPATSRGPFRKVEVRGVSQAVDELYSSFPAKEEFRDQRTFLWLARAKSRDRAIAEKIGKYLLIEITDAREDMEALTDKEDIRTVREFKSLEHVPTNGEIGAFTHKDTVGEYVLQVNIRLVELKSDLSPTPNRPSITNLEIPDDVPVGGDATVTWNIFNGSLGLEFDVRINFPGAIPQKTRAQQATFEGLPQGQHTVTISAIGAESVSGVLKIPGDKSLPPLNPLKILNPADGAQIQAKSITLEVERPGDSSTDVPLLATIASDILPAPIEVALNSSEKKQIDLDLGEYSVEVLQKGTAHRPRGVAGFSVLAVPRPSPGLISLTLPKEKSDPVPKGLVRVTWQASNIPSGSSYKATVFALDKNSKFQPQSKTTTANKASFNIEQSGKYSVQVICAGVSPSVRATREFEVGGGGGAFFAFLGLVAAVGGGYLLYRNFAGKRPEGAASAARPAKLD